MKPELSITRIMGALRSEEESGLSLYTLPTISSGSKVSNSPQQALKIIKEKEGISNLKLKKKRQASKTNEDLLKRVA